MALDTESASSALFGKFLNKELPSEAKQDNSSTYNKADEAKVTIPISIEKDVQKVSFQEPQGTVKTNISKPKWQNLDKVTVLLSTEQKEYLDKLAKKIMKYRSDATKGNQDKERITANTLIRVLVDVFLEREDQLQMEVITNEETARKWVEKLFLSISL